MAKVGEKRISFWGDMTQWAEKSGLSKYDQLNTAQMAYEPSYTYDVQRALDYGADVYVLDMERVPALEEHTHVRPWLDARGQDTLTDRQLCAAIAVVAEKIRVLWPALRIGAYFEGQVSPGAYLDNLRGVESFNGTPKDGVGMTVDFILVPARWQNHLNLDGWLSWRPDMIHQFRKDLKCQLYAVVNATAERDDPVDGIARGDPLSYGPLQRIVDAISPDVSGILWSDWPRVPNPYSEDLPYLKLTRDWQVAHE